MRNELKLLYGAQFEGILWNVIPFDLG